MLIKFNFYYHKHMYCNSKLQLHRLDGPSLEFNDGTKWWCKDGKNHREDGPAMEHCSGIKWYWLNGKQYLESEYCKIIKFRGFL